jgi:hypothetical protein
MCYIDTDSIEHISHYTKSIILLQTDSLNLLSSNKQDEIDLYGNAELFLTFNDLNKITLIKKYTCTNVEDLHTFMKNNDYPFELTHYIDNGLLTEM